MKIIRFSILVLVLFSLVSCDKSVYYEHNETIVKDEWSSDHLLKHEIMINDTMDVFNMFIHVRNHVDYAYCNLFLFVNTTFPNGQIAKDTLECLLAEKSGKWYGKGRGKYRDSKILFKPQLRFPLEGVYQIDIRQAMREEPLKGISNIGISLETKE
ncbi:MAG: gliding motility lipoprotein GldH [Bacteroidales bacterium]|nr:gliding motility lipoprotein GldH [Bacteroidales bacterium]MDY0216690.1 gliding motility lipoprotein GldH [Bacteroidales bacterium]